MPKHPTLFPCRGHVSSSLILPSNTGSLLLSSLRRWLTRADSILSEQTKERLWSGYICDISPMLHQIKKDTLIRHNAYKNVKSTPFYRGIASSLCSFSISPLRREYAKRPREVPIGRARRSRADQGFVAEANI